MRELTLYHLFMLIDNGVMYPIHDRILARGEKSLALPRKLSNLGFPHSLVC